MGYAKNMFVVSKVRSKWICPITAKKVCQAKVAYISSKKSVVHVCVLKPDDITMLSKFPRVVV